MVATAPSETPAAALGRLFKGTNAILGTPWVNSVNSGWSEASLHRQVVATGTVKAAKTRDVYGHYRTATQMQRVEGTYWRKDPAPGLILEALALNRDDTTVEDRMLSLRTAAIGAVLLVTQIPADNGDPQPAFITILAAPSVSTYASDEQEAGLIYDDIWDETAIAALPSTIISSDSNHAVLAAQEGFSRATLLQTKVISLLQDAQPIFLPSGQHLAHRVQLGAVSHLQAFFLPEVCNLPLGMRWPTSIGMDDFISSIQAALGKSSDHFISILRALRPSMELWFAAVALDHKPFLIPGRPFLSFYDKHFRDIRTGTWPPTILDQQGFSPLSDMLHGFVWRLWCDRTLTTGSPMDRKYLLKYLQFGITAITPTTYLGAAIPSRFCPNYAFHFKVTNGWPTDSPLPATQEL
jgi:hypothetical protein